MLSLVQCLLAVLCVCKTDSHSSAAFIDYFTISLHIANGRQFLPAIRDVQGDCERLYDTPVLQL